MSLTRKLQRLIFVLLIIFLPTQLGRHFWPEWSFASGVRVDYFSPTLYLTDILVISLVVLEVFKFKFSVKWLGILGVLGVLGIVNIYFSLSPAVSAYKWLKVAGFGFLTYWILKSQVKIGTIAVLLLTPVFYESGLAIWQFVNQASVGGLWYWLGERTFNSSTPGIANTIINDQLVLRPYGTFPHPNVLGGFLAVVLPLAVSYFLHNSRKINALDKFVQLGTLGIGYVALFLTMSRTAIFVGLVATLGRRVPAIGVIGLIGAFLVIGPVRLEREPVTLRQEFNALAIEEWWRSPILGTGLGTSPLYPVDVKNYALRFQPTHNIYLLILAETGIVGLGVLGGLGGLAMVKVYRKKDWILMTSLLSIAALGLFDHYFLTLQQGQLVLALVLGLSFRERVA